MSNEINNTVETVNAEATVETNETIEAVKQTPSGSLAAAATTATAKAKKPVFVKIDADFAGKADTDDIALMLRNYIDLANTNAQEAFKKVDRKGVMLQMKFIAIAERAEKAFNKAVARANRVRLSRDERKAFEATGALPAGIKVYDESELKDDDDDTDTDND